jgi:hypothetical protein
MMEAGEAERGAILLKKGGLGEGQKVRGLRGVGGLRGIRGIRGRRRRFLILCGARAF